MVWFEVDLGCGSGVVEGQRERREVVASDASSRNEGATDRAHRTVRDVMSWICLIVVDTFSSAVNSHFISRCDPVSTIAVTLEAMAVISVGRYCSPLVPVDPSRPCEESDDH